MSYISSFEIINAVIREFRSEGWPDPWFFFWIAKSVANIAANNPNGSKTLLAKGVSTLMLNQLSLMV